MDCWSKSNPTFTYLKRNNLVPMNNKKKRRKKLAHLAFIYIEKY